MLYILRERGYIMDSSKKVQVVDLKELFFVLLKNVWLVILLGVVGFVGVYIYSSSTEISTYTSEVSLYVKNTTNKTTIDSLSASDLMAAQTIAETYIAVLEDDVVNEAIGNRLLEKHTPEELANYFAIEEEDGKPVVSAKGIASTIDFSQVNDTELLSVSVTTADPVISADICNAITEIAPEQLIRVVGAGSVETVGRVKVPKHPNPSAVPKKSKMGLLLGVVLAIVIIYIRYIFDNTVNNGENVRDKYNIPMLGQIPFYDVEGSGNKKKNKTGFIARLKIRRGKGNELERSIRSTIKDVEVPFMVTEAYNTLRTNLLFALSTGKSNVAIVSSPFAGEGKSTSAANLAISIGETESKVLIIDGDLRKPTQHKLFKLKNEKGLSTLLSGMSEFEDTVNKNVIGNLDIVTSGPMPPNPSQMLTSENMTKLIEKVSNMYDYVIIDTSPVNIVSDALIMSKKTAGIMLVLRHGITTFDQVDKAIESIGFVDANILGIVVNSISADSNVYSKKGYRYNYKYKNAGACAQRGVYPV